MNQHFVGLSGGKDSLVTAIRALKRFESRPPSNLPPKFQTADTGNEWERLVGLVSRRRMATFFAAKMLPGDKADEGRAAIDNVVEWAKTSRGGRQFDMFQTKLLEENDEMEEMGVYCATDTFAGCRE